MFIILFAIAMVINTYLFPVLGIPDTISNDIVFIAKRGFANTLFLIGTGPHGTPQILWRSKPLDSRCHLYGQPSLLLVYWVAIL